MKERNYFPWSVKESTLVIREISNLFLEIREHSLEWAHFPWIFPNVHVTHFWTQFYSELEGPVCKQNATLDTHYQDYQQKHLDITWLAWITPPWPVMILHHLKYGQIWRAKVQVRTVREAFKLACIDLNTFFCFTVNSYWCDDSFRMGINKRNWNCSY